jgi:hypothetical protein
MLVYTYDAVNIFTKIKMMVGIVFMYVVCCVKLKK